MKDSLSFSISWAIVNLSDSSASQSSSWRKDISISNFSILSFSLNNYFNPSPQSKFADFHHVESSRFTVPVSMVLKCWGRQCQATNYQFLNHTPLNAPKQVCLLKEVSSIIVATFYFFQNLEIISIFVSVCPNELDVCQNFVNFSNHKMLIRQLQ